MLDIDMALSQTEVQIKAVIGWGGADFTRARDKLFARGYSNA